MKLELESGKVIENATEADILASIGGEEFAILGDGPDTYIQCAKQGEPPYEYVLEYQEGSLDRHFQAVDVPATLGRVISVFVLYLRRDRLWRLGFTWEKVALNRPGGQ